MPHPLRVLLLEVLQQRFTLDELEQLCFVLELPYEDLKGSSRREKALALVERIEREGRLHELRAELVRLRPDTGVAPPILSDQEPYLGLRAFQEEHADRFFGRALLVKQLAARYERAPLVAVVGASGSGKSSLVRAGLMPALKQGAVPGSARWSYLPPMTPGERPLDALAARLAASRQGNVLELRQMLARDERALLLLAETLALHAGATRVVLLVDQLEELWSQGAAADERAQFLRLLRVAITAGEGRQVGVLALIVTLRHDFLHRLDEEPELLQAVGRYLEPVRHMTADELRAAIVRPAENAGASFEPGLVDELVAQTAGREGALPLLEYTLEALWQARLPRREVLWLHWEAYQRLGGVRGALATRAEALLETFSDEEQALVRQLLLHLVRVGEGSPDTRRRVRLDELAGAAGPPQRAAALLESLVEARLLTTSPMAAGEAGVELSHEALLEAWPTLRRWIEEARADLRQQGRVEEAARHWEAEGRHPDYLWGGLPLASAEAWLARAAPVLEARARNFLEASRAKEHAAQGERARAERERAEAQVRLVRLLLRLILLMRVRPLVDQMAEELGYLQQAADESAAQLKTTLRGVLSLGAKAALGWNITRTLLPEAHKGIEVSLRRLEEMGAQLVRRLDQQEALIRFGQLGPETEYILRVIWHAKDHIHALNHKVAYLSRQGSPEGLLEIYAEMRSGAGTEMRELSEQIRQDLDQLNNELEAHLGQPLAPPHRPLAR